MTTRHPEPQPAGKPVRKITPKVGAVSAARTAPGQTARPARESLLVAAQAEFAEKGFAGARVDEIVALAGVNKQLVYHYFGSKEGLYRVVLESVYAAIREKERRLNLTELAPRDAMTHLVGFSFDYLAEHPEFIALLADENRNRGSHVRQSEHLQNMHSPFIDMLGRILARGVADGVFRADVDPLNLYISITGLCYFFFSNNHTLSAIFGKHLDTRPALARRRAHVIDFALNALRP